MKNYDFWVPLVLSIIVTPLALVLGLFSAGGGHGNYVLARILFPYTMLSTAAYGSITDLFFAVAIAQFPVYGVALAVAALFRQMRAGLIVLLVIHMVTVVLSFMFQSSNFTG